MATSSPPPFQNLACFLDAQGQIPYIVRASPHPTPSPHEVTIRTHAMPSTLSTLPNRPWASSSPSYLWAPGIDAAGVITAVGSSVSKFYDFKVGDRVLALADVTESMKSSNNAFQCHFATSARFVAKILDQFCFRDACVLPFALATASVALFQRKGLALPLPSVPRPTENQNKVVLVRG